MLTANGRQQNKAKTKTKGGFNEGAMKQRSNEGHEHKGHKWEWSDAGTYEDETLANVLLDESRKLVTTRTVVLSRPHKVSLYSPVCISY